MIGTARGGPAAANHMNGHGTASRYAERTAMLRIVGTALLAGAVGAGFSWGTARLLGVNAWISAVVSGLLLVGVVGGLMIQERRRGRDSGQASTGTPA